MEAFLVASKEWRHLILRSSRLPVGPVGRYTNIPSLAEHQDADDCVDRVVASFVKLLA
jgi:hypothetical protein